MQRQEINLYKKFQSPVIGKNLLSWKNFWLSQAAVVVLFIFACLSSFLQTHSLKVENEEVSTHVVELRDQFLHLQKKYPSILFSNNALLSLSQFEAELHNQEKVIDTITNRIPFSAVLS